MPEFFYKAKKGPSEVSEGVLFASSKQEAMRLVEEKGLFPIEIKLKEPPTARVSSVPASSPNTPKADTKKAAPVPSRSASEAFKRTKVSGYDICIFTRQMSSFLKSSVPLLNALELIKSQTKKKTLRDLVGLLAADVRNGSHFSETLETRGKGIFDTRYINMVRSGESGGSLDTVLEVLANSLETEEELRGQIRSAMMYPVLILAVGAGTVLFLLTFCLPKLSTLFMSTFQTLPLPTKILMEIAKPGCQAGIWALTVSAAVAARVLWFGGETQRKRRERMICGLPVLGEVKMKSDIARFCATFAMLIENGVPVYQAIEITRPVLSNELLKEDLAKAQARLLGGEPLSLIMREAKNFPSFVAQMVSVGEESGRLVESLKEVSRFYTRESLRGIKTATSLLEPSLILFLSMIVGFVVAGIMLPIFDLSFVK